MRKITEDEFEALVESTLDSIRQTLVVKGKEYRRNNNPFHNFDKGAEITGKTREEVLWGFALKHFISIQDIKEDLKQGKLPNVEVINEKYNDLLIYLLIEKVSIRERIMNEKLNTL